MTVTSAASSLAFPPCSAPIHPQCSPPSIPGARPLPSPVLAPFHPQGVCAPLNHHISRELQSLVRKPLQMHSAVFNIRTTVRILRVRRHMTRPTNRRRFENQVHQWDQITYLADKLEYWLHHGKSRRNAARYLQRLTRLLGKEDPQEESIIGQKIRSLVQECRGNTEVAVRHRRRQLALIKKLHSMGDLPRFARIKMNEITQAKRTLKALQRLRSTKPMQATAR